MVPYRFSGLEKEVEGMKKNYDLIIVGGGIYGMMLAMQACAIQLRPLLLEKHHFGHATSLNSFQIIHGGLRYLKTLNFRRYHEMVRERSWFLKKFPDLVKPLPFLLPLYNKGLHRKSVFRLALFLDACLSFNRNQGIRRDCYLNNGKILNREETISIFPDVYQKGLKGAALWYDAAIVDQDKLISKILKAGGTAIRFLEVKQLLLSHGKVQGVVAINTTTGSEISFESNVVVNATGPWCRTFAQKVDQDIPKLFYPSLAFNILFERKPLSDHALAVTPGYPGARTYFLRPLNNHLFAGTYHMRWTGQVDNPTPPEEDIDRFLSDLNGTIPELHLTKKDIKSIRAGFLPAKKEGSVDLAVQDIIIDHGKIGGPKGFYSISGVKWTISRNVAKRTLNMIKKNHFQS